MAAKENQGRPSQTQGCHGVVWLRTDIMKKTEREKNRDEEEEGIIELSIEFSIRKITVYKELNNKFNHLTNSQTDLTRHVPNTWNSN